MVVTLYDLMNLHAFIFWGVFAWWPVLGLLFGPVFVGGISFPVQCVCVCVCAVCVCVCVCVCCLSVFG